IEPGTDPAPLARIHRQQSGRETSQHSTSAVINLLCVATLTPRKGYDVLLDALASVPFDNWTLRCAGSADRDEATAARVRARLAEPRLPRPRGLVGGVGPA